MRPWLPCLAYAPALYLTFDIADLRGWLVAIGLLIFTCGRGAPPWISQLALPFALALIAEGAPAAMLLIAGGVLLGASSSREAPSGVEWRALEAPRRASLDLSPWVAGLLGGCGALAWAWPGLEAAALRGFPREPRIIQGLIFLASLLGLALSARLAQRLYGPPRFRAPSPARVAAFAINGAFLLLLWVLL